MPEQKEKQRERNAEQCVQGAEQCEQAVVQQEQDTEQCWQGREWLAQEDEQDERAVRWREWDSKKPSAETVIEDETAALRRSAEKRALRLLEVRDRTEKELRDRLHREEIPEDMVEQITEQMKRYGYLNDVRFSEHYIRMRIERKSKRQLFQSLLQKGVREEQILEAYEAVAVECGEDAELLAAQKAARQYCGSRWEPTEQAFQKLKASLFRKGFRMDMINRVCEEIKETAAENA